MDSPQYLALDSKHDGAGVSFKPYYKWIVLNTYKIKLPVFTRICFKPYYKWIVLNTLRKCAESAKENLF